MNILSNIKSLIKYPIESLFNYYENRLLSGEENQPCKSPIFILGVPRSGTTLLLQLMIRHFKLCFFTNFTGKFCNSPIVAGRLSSLFNGCDPIENYNSFYGRTKSWKEPYDGAKIWSHWFSIDPVYVNKGYLDYKSILEIRKTIYYFEKYYNAPFINKAQRNNGRILEINRIFPNSLFVIVKRDFLEVVQSIYIGFSKLNKKNMWFSMKPSNWRDIKSLDLIEHICEEVYYTDKDIHRDLRAIGYNRCYITDYNTICDKPQFVLDQFSSFYSNYSKENSLEVRHAIPQYFTKSASSHCNETEIMKIKHKLSSLTSYF